MHHHLLDTDEIYPAPAVDDVVPNTLDKLSEYLVKNPEHLDARFLFGNLLLQNSEFVGAKEQYTKVLKKAPSNTAARCNYAISLRLQGKVTEAEKEFKKVILKAPDLLLAHRNLALLALNKGDEKAATASLQNVIRIDNSETRSLLTLAHLAKNNGDFKTCRTHANKVLKTDSTNNEAHSLIGYLEFIKGRTLFEEGDLLGAFKSWNVTMTKHSAAFIQSADLVREKLALEKQFRDSNLLDDAINLFSKGINDKEIEQRDYYDLFILFFFSVGLIPEVFEEPEQLKDRFELWKERFSSVPSYPYAKFRLAVIYCYCGQLNDAFEFFTACRDEIPATKSESLKLSEVIAFCQKVRRMTRDEDELPPETIEGDWNVFEDSFQRKAWQRSGLSPEEAVEWFDCEIAPQQAKLWKKAEITPEEAKSWKEHGFIVAKDALRLRNSGFTPQQAGDWAENFPHDNNLALQCRSVGFTDPIEAADWLRVLMFPSEAWQWKEMGFQPADVVLYRSDGITDPHTASRERAKKIH